MKPYEKASSHINAFIAAGCRLAGLMLLCALALGLWCAPAWGTTANPLGSAATPEVRNVPAAEKLEVQNANASGSTYYSISVDKVIYNGKLETSVYSAVAGEEVTVYVTPNDGYVPVYVEWYSNNYYESEDITADTSGVYSFIMPPKDITVTAWFSPVPPVFTLSAGSGNLRTNLTYDEIEYGEEVIWITSETNRLTVYESAATASEPVRPNVAMIAAAEDITETTAKYFTLSMEIIQGEIPYEAYLGMETETEYYEANFWFYDYESDSYKNVATEVLPWPGIGEEANYYGEIYAADESGWYSFSLTIVGAADPIPGSGGGGGGGGGKAAESETGYDVINETNTENVSSDTTLTLHNSAVDENGVSTTEVDGGAVDALLDMAQRHKDDLPDADGEAIINITDPPGEGATEYVVNMKREDVQRLVDSGLVDTLEVRTPKGSIRLHKDAMQGLEYDENGYVKFDMSTFDYDGRPGVDFTVDNSGVEVVEVAGTYGIQIRIPYELREGETAEGLVIEYIRNDGTTEIVTECRYDAENGYIYGYVEHLSKYAVSYKVSLFSDVPASHWANGYIIFLASRGIINGMGDGSFQPDANVTRAQFVNMITKAFSTAKVGEPVQVYPDVKATEWYAPAVTWSYMNNIANAIVSNNLFRPDSDLTREDMATLSNNASVGMALRLKENASPIIFNDEADISVYAEDSVQRMVRCGIIAGMAEGVFLPGGTCTRAQAAKVISELLSKM